MKHRTFGRLALGLTLLAPLAPLATHAARAQMPAPGPFERNWDWSGNRRALTFCVAPGTPALMASAAQFAASNLSNAAFQWTVNYVGICPANWDLRKPVAGQADIRVRVADLGPVVVKPNGNAPHDYEREDDDYPYGGKPSPDRVPAPGGAPRFAQPPLAYFQPGPILPGGGRWIRAGEVVYNWKVPMGKVVDPKWDIAIGTPTFDPREVGMHELGHAIRLKHDDDEFDDDVSVFPTGSRPGVNVVIVQRGKDNVLQTRRLGDDAPAMNGDLTAGADGVADSGKKINVMTTEGGQGQHGINPLLGFPPNSAYSYTDREQATAIAAKNNRPAGPAPILAGADSLRHQVWGTLTLWNAAGQPVATFSPGTTGNGVDGDFLSFALVPAVRWTAVLDVNADNLPGSSHVTITADLGTTSAMTPVQVYVPMSSTHPNLVVQANWAADTISISDGTTVLCSGQLSYFQPIDCAADPNNPDFFNLGFVSVVLSPAPLSPPPPPPPPPFPSPTP